MDIAESPSASDERIRRWCEENGVVMEFTEEEEESTKRWCEKNGLVWPEGPEWDALTPEEQQAQWDKRERIGYEQDLVTHRLLNPKVSDDGAAAAGAPRDAAESASAGEGGGAAAAEAPGPKKEART
jgi:hypothetical protein